MNFLKTALLLTVFVLLLTLFGGESVPGTQNSIRDFYSSQTTFLINSTCSQRGAELFQQLQLLFGSTLVPENCTFILSEKQMTQNRTSEFKLFFNEVLIGRVNQNISSHGTIKDAASLLYRQFLRYRNNNQKRYYSNEYGTN